MFKLSSCKILVVYSGDNYVVATIKIPNGVAIVPTQLLDEYAKYTFLDRETLKYSVECQLDYKP